MAVATAQRAVHGAERQRTEIEEYQRRTLARAGEASQSDIDADQVRRLYQFERHLAQLAVDKDAAIIDFAKTVDARRLELEEAMKQRRIVERLMENAQETLEEELRKHEYAANDEVATMRAGAALVQERRGQ